MKIAVAVIVFISATRTLCEGEDDLQFKPLYVDPIRPASIVVTPRITHGFEAVPHSIPYQAYIKIVGFFSNWLCSGSLIAPKYVLTAGHCVQGGIMAEVHLGAHNIQEDEDSQILAIGYNLILHDGFDKDNVTNDIGLIELTEEVQLNKFINVARLPSRGDRNTYEGYVARVSGWGRTSGAGATSPVLLEVNTTVITNDVCKNFYGMVREYHICTAGDNGIGTCNGDSGGPLVAGNVVIGVVSYGAKQCLAGYPSGHTRTSSFLDWIEKNMND